MRSGRRTASAIGIALAMVEPAFGQPVQDRYYDHFGMMGWGGWFYGPVMMVIFFALLVGAVVLIVRLIGGDPRSGGSEDKALQILRERFARGDISREEFDEARKALE